jgi:TetR/AcrR family transcriptional regulator
MNKKRITDKSTEERILAAATRIFLRSGKDGARMQEIADEAGINKALLHYYFRSKEQLYREVVLREVSGFFRELVASFSGEGEIEEFIRFFIDNYIDRLAGNPQVVRFLTWELGSGGAVVRDVVREAVMGAQSGALYRKYTAVLDRAVREGRIRPVDPQHLIMNVLGMCLYTFLAAPILEHIFPGLRIQDERFIARRKTEIFELVWRGIAV